MNTQHKQIPFQKAPHVKACHPLAKSIILQRGLLHTIVADSCGWVYNQGGKGFIFYSSRCVEIQTGSDWFVLHLYTQFQTKDVNVFTAKESMFFMLVLRFLAGLLLLVNCLL